MSTLIQTKEFVTYKSPLDSFEVANERFLGILEPGLIRGFDNLTVNSALSFTLIQSSGIEKTTKAGNSTTNRTGILYTRQGTILHFSDDFGPVSITRDSEQSSSDIYWAVGVLHKYVSEEGINPIVLKVSEPSISEAAAISDMESDDSYNTILIGVLSFKPNGTSEDIDLQTNRSLFTWEPKPSGDIAGHKNASKSEIDIDTIVRTLNDQTINGEKSFSDPKGISEANPLVKIPITNNIQNRVYSKITSNNNSAIFKVDRGEFIYDEDLVSVERTVHVLINIIDPSSVRPLNATVLVEVHCDPETYPTYKAYLINSNSQRRTKDILKMIRVPGDPSDYIVYYHGPQTGDTRLATFTYIVSDPKLRGFHPVDNDTKFNANPNHTSITLAPTTGEELLKYSQIGINAKVTLPESAIEDVSGTNKYKYITLGKLVNIGSYCIFNISGSFVYSDGTLSERFNMIAMFSGPSNNSQTEGAYCNIIISPTDSDVSIINSLASMFFFCYNSNTGDIMMSIMDGNAINKPYKYRDKAYSDIKAYITVSLIDSSESISRLYRLGICSLPTEWESRPSYASWVVNPIALIGLSSQVDKDSYTMTIKSNVSFGGTTMKDITYYDGNTSIGFATIGTSVPAGGYVKSCVFDLELTDTEYGELESNWPYCDNLNKKLYIKGTGSDSISVGVNHYAQLDTTDYLDVVKWWYTYTVNSTKHLVIFIDFGAYVRYDTTKKFSIIMRIEA